MNAPQELQVPIVEALAAERNPIYAGRTVLGKTATLHRTGIGLEGNFRCRSDIESHADRLDDFANGIRREQARRSATKKNTEHTAVPYPGSLKLEIAIQRREIALFRHRALDGVRVEVAIRALAHAPRQVDVYRERWIAQQCHGRHSSCRGEPGSDRSPRRVCAAPGRDDSADS